MLENNDYLEKRLDKNFVISDVDYIKCLLDITEWFWFELKYHLKNEHRLFGIVISYMNSVDKAISQFNNTCTEEDCDIFGKALYLYKPLLVKEYRRLGKKRISKADRLIVITKRISDYLLNISENHPNYKEIKTLDKIVTKLYNNIKNDGKLTELPELMGEIKKYYDLGLIGKYQIDIFSLDSEADWNNNKHQKEYIGNKVKMNSETSDKILEISWTDKK